jgi:hypothetical protein
MELRDYIEQGAQKAGSVSALARYLGINQPDLSHAKSQKRGLTDEALSMLADYIGADYRAIVAANKLVTEKKEQKRAYWRPFLEQARAASIALTLAAALVSTYLTPCPANAATASTTSGKICIM